MKTRMMHAGGITCSVARGVLYGAFAIFTAACSNSEPPASTGTNDTQQTAPAPAHTYDTSLANTTDADTSEYAIVYMLIADTGQDYYSLHKVMQTIATTLQWPVDTMGRYYNKKKKEIVLPDDDEDEIYRGEYFPRRYASTNLSLEYYRSYADSSTTRNIALVAAISNDEHHADSLLTRLGSQAPHAFVHKTKLYMGCMH